MPLLFSCLFNGLFDVLDLVLARLTLPVPIVQSLIVFTSPVRVIEPISHVRVLVQWVVFSFLRVGFHWVNLVLRTQLLIIVLCSRVRFLKLSDIVAHIMDLLYKIHVVGHDLQIVSLVDLTFNLKSFL